MYLKQNIPITQIKTRNTQDFENSKRPYNNKTIKKPTKQVVFSFPQMNECIAR